MHTVDKRWALIKWAPSACAACKQALPEDGKLYALDKDERSMSVARRYWEKAGVKHKVVERLGSAQDTLLQLKDEGPFDIAFIGESGGQGG